MVIGRGRADGQDQHGHHGRTVTLVVALVLLLWSVGAAAATAAPGDLDPSFGNGGQVVFPPASKIGDKANAVAIQPDGKILVAGTVTTNQMTGATEVVATPSAGGKTGRSVRVGFTVLR